MSEPVVTVSDLAGWLLARLDEAGQDADDVHDTYRCDSVGSDPSTPFPCDCGYPTRILARAAADRRIVELHGDQHECPDWQNSSAYPYIGCDTLRLLALPYAGHDGYREEWKP